MLHVLLTGLTIQLPHAYQKMRQISNGSYSAVSIVVERGTEGPLLAAKTVQDTTLEGKKNMLLIKLALKIDKFALNIDKLAPITLH